MHSNWIIYLIVGIILWGLFVWFFYSRNTPTTTYIAWNTKKTIQNIVASSWVTWEIKTTTGGLNWEDNITTLPKEFILKAFTDVTSVDKYDKFITQYGDKKVWVPLIAAKTKDKALWDKYWNFEFNSNTVLQGKFKDITKFTPFIADIYTQIRNDSLQINTGNDISIIFSSTKISLQDAIKACSSTVDAAFFRELLYTYRATNDNQYCEKINAKDSPSMYNLCTELIQ